MKEKDLKISDNVKEVASEILSSNPLSDKAINNASALSSYTQVIPKPKYDSDSAGLVEIVRVLNNLAPLSMPVYCFDTELVNGERYYTPDGKLHLIREYDSDVFRDYYVSPKEPEKILLIREQDKRTGRLKVKIEQTQKTGTKLKTNITIFDEKINNKYTLMQLDETGTVLNITEFSGQGQSFRTLFRSAETLKPVRYLEGNDTKTNGFEMVDCIFDSSGNVARIKKYNNKKEINIEYSDNNKSTSVKLK